MRSDGKEALIEDREDSRIGEPSITSFDEKNVRIEFFLNKNFF